MSGNNGSSHELTAPVVWKDEARRIVYGPVLVPGEKDSDGDVVSVEKIELVAHKFLETYGQLDAMHTITTVARPVESFIAPTDLDFGTVTVPKGSWIMGARITDDAVWKSVLEWQTDGFGGFSIMAVPKKVPEGVSKSEVVAKRTTLRDFEDAGLDWEVVLVSIVDAPAVPSAKWISVKREEPTFWSKMRSAMSPTPTTATFTTKSDEGEQEMTPEEMKELFGQVIDEKLVPVNERIDALAPVESELENLENLENLEEEDSGDKLEITQEELDLAMAGAAEKAVESVMSTFDEHLQSRPRPSVKSLAESLSGQDGHVSKSEDKPSRDAWGRRVS